MCGSNVVTCNFCSVRFAFCLCLLHYLSQLPYPFGHAFMPQGEGGKQLSSVPSPLWRFRRLSSVVFMRKPNREYGIVYTSAQVGNVTLGSCLEITLMSRNLNKKSTTKKRWTRKRSGIAKCAETTSALAKQRGGNCSNRSCNNRDG